MTVKKFWLIKSVLECSQNDAIQNVCDARNNVYQNWWTQKKVSVPFERLMNRQLYCIVLHFPALIHLFSVLNYILVAVAVTHILTTLLCFLAHRKVGRLHIFEAFHEMFVLV